MRTRTYIVSGFVGKDEVYALLILFPGTPAAMPYRVYSFMDGDAVMSGHATRTEAAELLLHWRKNNLRITRTG